MAETNPSAARRWAAHGLVLTVTVLTVVLTPTSAAACSCAEPPPPEVAVAEADAVFAGEVVETRVVGEGPSGDLIARIAVDEVWKGDVAQAVEVRTASDSATCGYHFRSGGHDLVYAQQADDGSFTTHLCTRSVPLERAGEDLAALGDGGEPLAEEQRTTASPAWPWIATVSTVGLIALAVVAWRLRRPGAP